MYSLTSITHGLLEAICLPESSDCYMYNNYYYQQCAAKSLYIYFIGICFLLKNMFRLQAAQFDFVAQYNCQRPILVATRTGINGIFYFVAHYNCQRLLLVATRTGINGIFCFMDYNFVIVFA